MSNGLSGACVWRSARGRDKALAAQASQRSGRAGCSFIAAQMNPHRSRAKATLARVERMPRWAGQVASSSGTRKRESEVLTRDQRVYKPEREGREGRP